MNAIPTDKAQRARIVQRVQLRMFRSANWSTAQRAEWVRYYKIWRKIQDMVMDPDEPNIFLGYAFGIVESIVAKTTEPILKMRPPCNVLPLRLGDGQAAENFKNIARNLYSKPNFQEPFYRSKKEMGICGTRFEIDEWQNVQRKGKMWGKVQKMVSKPLLDMKGQPVMRNGKPVMTPPLPTMVDAEVERSIPVHYGFHTRYPSIFDIYPEPDRKTIGTGQPTDVSWLIEDMGERSLAEMCREMYVDPHDGVTKPVYDFTELLHDAGRRAQERYAKIMKGESDLGDDFGPLIVPIRDWNYATDYGNIDKTSVYPSERTVDRASSEDQDKVWVVRMMMDNELVTVCQGRYLIQRKLDPLHVPGIPARSECYTIDPEFLYGQGIIKPIADEIMELNDIHNLSMASWIRIIDKMVAIDESKIVSLEDFKPRAGGKIRVKGDVRSAIAAVDQMDPTPSMLNQESNARGLIEFISGHMDGSPGTRGTKQDHKTKGGLELLQFNLNTRFVTMQRQALINEARRMMSMSRFFDQFAFEKQPFRVYKDDGSTALAEFNKDDVFTEGRGFEFAIEIDPNFGDSQVQRQEDLFLMDRAYEYEKMRRELRDPRMRQLNVDKLMEKVLRDFGHVDMTRLFTAPDNSMSPDDELQIIMQGGIAECRGDLMHHIESHILQRGAPNLIKAVEAGKAAPDTIKKLELLIAQAMARLQTFAADPQLAVEKRKSQALGAAGGPELG